MASLKVPAFRTCSQVRVVRLAVKKWHISYIAPITGRQYIVGKADAYVNNGALVSRLWKNRQNAVTRCERELTTTKAGLLTAKGGDWGIDGLDKHTFVCDLWIVDINISNGFSCWESCPT